jgi:hypothetical protein
MMQVIAITVSRSGKFNIGNYESRDAFASATVELEDGDRPDEVYQMAWATVQRQIHEQEQIIRTGDKTMPIRDLQQGAMFPIIGHIRKGAPKGENGPGKDLDYFRVEFDGDDAALMSEQFVRLYGAEPRELKIMLLDDDINRVFDAWRETYVSGGLTHRCDGEFVVYPPEQRGQKCTLKNHADKKQRCKPAGRLRVLIPELGRAGMLVVHTTSWNDIREIYGNLEAVLSLAGRLTGIPLILRRVKRDVSYTDDSGKRKKYSKWLLHIEISQEWVQRRIEAMQRASLIEASSVPMLVSGDLEDDDGYDIDIETGEVILGEFEQEQPVKKHWIDDSRAAFWGWARGTMGLTETQVHEALGVEHVRDFAGDKKAAVELIKRYAVNMRAEEPEAPASELDEWFDSPPSTLAAAMRENSLLCPAGTDAEALAVWALAKERGVKVDAKNLGAAIQALEAMIDTIANKEAVEQGEMFS